MDRDVARGAVFLDRVNQIGWIGNYVQSFAMIGIGIAFDVWSVVLMGLAAGVPGGLVTHCAIVRRSTAFRARSQGSRLGVLVVTAEFFVAREWVAKADAGRGPA